MTVDYKDKKYDAIILETRVEKEGSFAHSLFLETLNYVYRPDTYIVFRVSFYVNEIVHDTELIEYAPGKLGEYSCRYDRTYNVNADVDARSGMLDNLSIELVREIKYPPGYLRTV